MSLQFIWPQQGSLAAITAADNLAAYAAETRAALADFSQILLSHDYSRQHPQLMALGFFLRQAQIQNWHKDYLASNTTQQQLQPSGLVLHFPPANVEVMLVYSLALSWLLGNRNIVRVPQRQSPTQQWLLQQLCALLERHPLLGARTILLSYGHEHEITQSLTDLCDLRVIFGGDAAVKAIRAASLPALAREMVFPNRFSMAAINVDFWQNADAHTQQKTAADFYNDCYWFDQRGCASPRLLLWVGADATAQKAHQQFLLLLDNTAKAHHWQLDAGSATQKSVALFLQTLALQPHAIERPSPRLTSFWLADLSSLPQIRQADLAYGCIAALSTTALTDIAPYATRRDQTLALAGFSSADISALATTLNGRGFDRLVPLGQALNFSPLWDGHNLLTDFGRWIAL